MKVYQPNMENMQSYLKDNSSSYDGTTWYNIPHGMSSIRILPPWDPTGRVALPVYSHRIEFQGKGMKYKKYSWTCVDRTFGKPCKICESLSQLKQVGVDISEYEPNSRTFYCNVMVMYDPEFDRDLKSGKPPANCGGSAPGTHAVMKLPKTIYDWVVSNITNPMVGDITSIENGIDIYITKEGSGLGTSYSATLSPNGRTAIPREYLEKIEALYNLDEIFSTGFEDEVVEDLTNSLKRSSNMLGSGIQNMSSQMSGIPQQQYSVPFMSQPQQPMQTPQQFQNPNSIQTPVQQPPMQPPHTTGNPLFTTPPAFGQGVPATQQAPNVQTPPQQMSAPQVQQQVPQNSGNPECFGKYNPGDIKCVTCSSEVPCSQLKA